MSVVISLANEKKAAIVRHESLQRSFFNILHIVAAVSFMEVQRCFSLNMTTWGDIRLWGLVINRSMWTQVIRICP